MNCRLLTQYAIVMVQFLAGLRKKNCVSRGRLAHPEDQSEEENEEKLREIGSK